MSGAARLFNYCKQNPIALYLGGGVVIHLLRSVSVNNAYRQHFAKFDVERHRELEQYLSQEKH
jgi:hypothetical protein